MLKSHSFWICLVCFIPLAVKSQEVKGVADLVKLYDRSTSTIMNQAPFGLMISSKAIGDKEIDNSRKNVEAEMWYIDSLHSLFINGSVLQIVNNDTILKIDTLLKMALLSPVKKTDYDFKANFESNFSKGVHEVILKKEDDNEIQYLVTYMPKYSKYGSVEILFDKKKELIQRTIINGLPTSSSTQKPQATNDTKMKKISAIENSYSYKFKQKPIQQWLICKLVKKSDKTWALLPPYNSFKVVSYFK